MKTLDGRADLVRAVVQDGPKAGTLTGRIIGVSRCSSPWLCPICGPRIALKRAESLKPQIDKLVAAGWSAWLITLTARHKRGERLSDAFAMFQKAWGLLTSGKAIAKKRADIGGLEYVRGYDLTHGRNGWHLHFHLVLLVGPGGGTGEAVADWVLSRWSRAITTVGGSVLPRALDKRPAGNAVAAAAYAMTLAGVAKQKNKTATNGAASLEKVGAGFASIAEATAAAAKRGRSYDGGQTAADLRRAAIDGWDRAAMWMTRSEAAKKAEDLKQAEWCEEQAANAGQYAERSAALYIEFAQATLGKRAVVVSQGLRLKDEEKAAEEDEIEMPEIVGYLRERGLSVIDREMASVLAAARASVEAGRKVLEDLLGPPGLDGLWRIPTKEEEETDWASLRREAKQFDEAVRKRRAEADARQRGARQRWRPPRHRTI